MVRHAKITQNNKFTISLQYPKKQMRDEVDFFLADKHERFLWIDTIIFDRGWSSIPKVPKTARLQYLCDI